MIGETIKGFQITGRLGKGGMGEVWVAEQQIIKTRVAIKFLLAELSTDQQLVQRFFNEAIAVSRIKHAGIVKIHDVGFHNGAAFLIMELLEGETLASRLRRMIRLPLGNVGDIGRQIASVLAATHAEHITHRDLKPDNTFLVRDAELASGERVKVLDFGIAKLGTSVGLTGSNLTIGTPGYMAPEQWTDAARADARADVYALGCVAFEMCCGRPPFEVSTVHEAYAKHVHELPPRARAFAANLPVQLDEAIAAALEKKPDDRPSMKELQNVFAEIAAAHPVVAAVTPGGGGAAAGTVVMRPPAARPAENSTLRGAVSSTDGGTPRAKRWWPVIGAVVVGGIGITIYIATRPHEAGPTDGAAPAPSAKSMPVEPTPAKPTLAEPARAEPTPNAWVLIKPPAAPIRLGIDRDDAPAALRGLRPARNVMSPLGPYEIQEHEVTWSEIEPWLATQRRSLPVPPWAADPKQHASLPVAGVTWSMAREYCQSLGGTLPTEQQWEYAARGPERRPNSWGPDLLDRTLTHAYAGTTGTPIAVKTSLQDQTPGTAIYDLMGNVQEWTLGLWRPDVPEADETWVSSGETSVRAIRGLPLAADPPRPIPPSAAAYRDQLCATGPCVDKGAELRRYVGFRCARAAK